MIYSFDVYDTLITRTTATPKGIFALMQNRIENEAMYLSINEKMQASFFDVRAAAEESARRLYISDKKEEISLSEIYDVIRMMIPLSDSETDALIELEIETEINNTVAVKENIDELLKIKQSGCKIILLSDMYLPDSVIKKILISIHPAFEDIPIYVSSKYGRTKATGHLYSLIRRLENLYDEQWTHIGDNEFSDCTQAERKGIIPLRNDICLLTPKEKQLIEGAETSVQYQLLIGASRNARIGNCDEVYRMGTTIGSALLIPYAEWLIKQCKILNIERVYFVARDGFLLKKIFEVLLKPSDKIISSYLYGSRRAWNISLKNESMNDINAEDLKNGAADRTEQLIGYLKQEINDVFSKIAFVEVHGTGKTQENLCNIVDTITDSDLISFYYFLENDVNDKRHHYYSYRGISSKNSHIIEFFTRALHGQTIGYEKQGDRFEPILWDDENGALKEFGYDKYIAGVIKTAELYSAAISQNHVVNVKDEGIAGAYVDYLLDESFAMGDTLWCDIPFGNEMDDGYRIVRYAPKLNKKLAKSIFEDNNGNTNGTDYDGYSLYYSQLRCDDEMKNYIAGCIKNGNERNPISQKKYRIKEGELGKKVVLYGAGKVGTCIYEQLKNNPDIKCVAWIDGVTEGKPAEVKLPSSIAKMSYDQVIIAVLNGIDKEDIEWELKQMGVPGEKIYWSDYRI